MHDPLFRADQRQDLAHRIERYAVTIPIPSGECVAQHGGAFIGLITVIPRFGRFSGKRGHHLRMGRLIGTSDAEVDYLASGGPHLVDLTQLLREVVLLDAAQPFGQFHFDRIHFLLF